LVVPKDIYWHDAGLSDPVRGVFLASLRERFLSQAVALCAFASLREIFVVSGSNATGGSDSYRNSTINVRMTSESTSKANQPVSKIQYFTLPLAPKTR